MNGLSSSMAGGEVSRRRFLLSLLGMMAASAVRICGADAAPANDLPPWLTAISGRPEAVLHFGAAYLQQYPEENDREQIIATIEARMEDQSGAATTESCVAEQLLILQRVVRGEYLRGEFVRVEGWSLSLTEARFYAAVALWTMPDQ